MSEAPQKRPWQFSLKVLLLAMGMVGVGMGLVRWDIVIDTFPSSALPALLVLLGFLLMAAAPIAVFVGRKLSPKEIKVVVWYIIFIIIAVLVVLLVGRAQMISLLSG